MLLLPCEQRTSSATLIARLVLNNRVHIQETIDILMNVHHFLVIQSCEGNLYVLVTFCSLQVQSNSESRGIQNGE